MKLFLIFSFILFIICSCQVYHSPKVEVLGEQIIKNEAERFVVNGGPGSTEAIYQDGNGQQQTAVSNTIKIPILDKCDTPPPPEVVEEPQETPHLIEEPLPEIQLVRYQADVHSFSNHELASNIEPPEVFLRTTSYIPLQPPKIELQKSSDEDKLCCDRQLKFRIRFTNIGGMDAEQVIISDIVPAGVDYIEETAGADPYPATIKLVRDQNDAVQKIVWEIQSPIPSESSGEVYYSVSCPRPKPKLNCFVQFDPKYLSVGQDSNVICRVVNTGAGSAEAVTLTVNIPEGLSYKGQPYGVKETFILGEIPANQSAEKILQVRMLKGGRLDNITATINSSNAPLCECSVPPTPTLTLEKSGPMTVINRVPIEYTIVAKNTSSKNAQATGCVLTDKLPSNATFKSCSGNGYYNGQEHTVTWLLGTMLSGESKDVTVTVMPQETGNLLDYAQISCEEGITADDQARTIVRGVPAVQISSYDTEDPVEVGGTTTYIIEVGNEGFQNVTDLELFNEIPATSAFINATAADGAGILIKHRLENDGMVVVFDKYPSLAPAEKLIYKITVKVNAHSQLLNRASLKYQEFTKTIIVEEPTESY